MNILSRRLPPVLLPLLAALLLACGGDDAAPDAGETPDAAETPPAVAFDAAKLQALAAVEVPGYTALEPLLNAGSATLSYRADAEVAGARLLATVTLTPCDPFICGDLDAEVTPERQEGLLSLLPRIHIDNEDLVFEYGTVELAPRYEGFFVYQRSYVRDESSTATANGYRVFYHDGVNHIALLITPRSEGGAADSEEELIAQMDQASGEAAAKEVFAAFEAEFAPAD